MTTWHRFKIWNNWRAVSRVFGCALMAMRAEAKDPRYKSNDDQKIGFVSGGSSFEVTETEYVRTLNSPQLVCGMILQAYCGLIEEHARDVLRELHQIGVDVSALLDSKYPSFEDKIDHFPPPNGIEDWGPKILALVGRDWIDVKPGRAKIVEVIVVRNALAHGTPEVTKRMVNRIENVGGSLPWKEGSRIKLSYDSVKDYKDQLRSFARVLSDATAALMKAHQAAPKKSTKPKSSRQKNG